MEKKECKERTKNALGCLIAVLIVTAAILTCNQLLQGTIFNNPVGMELLAYVYGLVFAAAHIFCIWLLRKCGVTITKDYLK